MTYRTMQALGLAVTLLHRAMEKCDRRTDIPRRHRAGSQLDHQRAALLMRSSNGLPSRTNVCTRRKRTCGPQGGSEKATLSGGCGSTGQSCNMRQCPCQFLFVTKKTFQQYLATGRPQHAFTCGNHFSGSRIVGLMPQDLAGPERRSLAGSAALERNFPLRAEVA